MQSLYTVLFLLCIYINLLIAQCHCHTLLVKLCNHPYNYLYIIFLAIVNIMANIYIVVMFIILLQVFKVLYVE